MCPSSVLVRAGVPPLGVGHIRKALIFGFVMPSVLPGGNWSFNR
jgi:hypothetical protein